MLAPGDFRSNLTCINMKTSHGNKFNSEYQMSLLCSSCCPMGPRAIALLSTCPIPPALKPRAYKYAPIISTCNINST